MRTFNHGDTEDTEEMDFSLAGRRRPGKSASAFGGVPFMEKPRWSSQITAEKLPKGLRSFARSSSPDRAKKGLTKINYPCDYSLQCVPMICLLLQTSDPHN
jgi:hypothetical protein